METYTNKLEDLHRTMYDLAEDMAADGDERCNDVEDLRLQLLSIMFPEQG